MGVSGRYFRQLLEFVQGIAFEGSGHMAGRCVEGLVDGQESSGRCVGRHCGQAPDIDSLPRLAARRPVGRFVRGTVIDWDGYDLIVRPDRS